MDYSRPELADRLAAEYVLGTLQGAARRRFESLLPAHPALRAAVRGWEQRLVPLTSTVLPQAPSPRVWKGIEGRLFGELPATAAAQAAGGWWTRLAVWRACSAVAGVAVLALAVLLANPAPTQPPIVVVLSAATPGPGGVTPASFVASVSGDGRAMVTRPLVNVALQPDRALELWSVPAQGAPRSLGLISANGATVVSQRRVLEGTAAFAVSLEPPGGSPTGAPTGPILYVGKLTS
ncbi:MAG: anti-sigma factor [Proteobacteria bacterium]|nr:anti-sigma factor [Pseudomonadota bacterium]